MTTQTKFEEGVLESLHSLKHIKGYTHNFYRYPARMLPELAHDIIINYSLPGDIVLDPFMGGGTSVIESIAIGRRVIGIDINSLATFVTDVKTTPLSIKDENTIYQWGKNLDFSELKVDELITKNEPRAKNLPLPVYIIFERLLENLHLLQLPRQKRFARCCLLRLGQWAIDGRDSIPNNALLKNKFFVFLQEMYDGLSELVIAAQNNGIAKNKLTDHRILLHRSSIGIDEEKKLYQFKGKPSLVITSPPYPNVHMLYHRWQVKGRKETPVPYWFIGMNDGQGASYYTLGSRSLAGQDNYFRSISNIYRSIRAIIHPDALVAQLVSFGDVENQLKAFLQAMEFAGFDEIAPTFESRTNLWRTVPNRKWYNKGDATRGCGKELLLFHRPRN